MMSEGKKRYLIVLWEGGGVVPPVLGVARRLVERGHRVRVLGDPTIEAEALGAGCGFSPWTTAPHRTTRDRDTDILRDYAYKKERMKYFDLIMREFLADPGPRWTADILGEVASHPADAILTEAMIPWGVLAAEKAGVPSAVLMTTPLSIPTPGIPPFGMGLAPATGPLGRLRDAAMRWMSVRMMGKALPSINSVRQAHGLAPLASFYDQVRRADRVLVLTSPRFDFTSPSVPQYIRWVGPQLCDPPWTGTWRSPWGESDTRPLVLIALSSTFQDQVPLLRNIVEAMAGVKARGLVTLGPAIRAGEVVGSDNVVVVASAPHGEVLRQAAALVTHCGHGTTIKGLAAGVPLVCIPMGRDQKDNAVRVVHRGAGVGVDPAAKPAAIRAAIEKVLSDLSYREAARRLGAAIASGEGCSDVVTEVEAITATARPGAAAAA